MPYLIGLILYHLLTFYLVSASDKVRLTDIKTLSFHQGSYTAGRRSSPVPHLTCTSGSACGQDHLQPTSAQCYNQGSDGFDVQWKCNADLDNSVRFGQTIVSCEGYDYPDDPYVLKGSCGLEYTLEFVNAGSNKGYQSSHSYNNYNKNGNQVPTTLSSLGSLALCVVGILFLLWICSPSNGSNSNTPSGTSGSGYPGGGGGGGGGSGFGWRRPDSGPQPPPYDDPYSSYDDSGASCGSRHRAPGVQTPGFGSFNPMGGGAYRRRGNGPGFWSGMAAGGLMGYMFGNRNNSYGRNSYGYGQAGPSHAGPSWGHSPGSGGGGGSFSGGSRNATGFGGTRRR